MKFRAGSIYSPFIPSNGSILGHLYESSESTYSYASFDLLLG